jgi:predicted methyltransferase
MRTAIDRLMSEVDNLTAKVYEQRSEIDALTDQLAEAKEESHLFRELMAMMHSDGGHYYAKHGAKKSYDDAVEKYYKLVVAAEDKP